MNNTTKTLLTTTAAAAALATGAMTATTVHADADTPADNNQASQAPATSAASTQDQINDLKGQLQEAQASQATADQPKIAAKQDALNQSAASQTASENAAYQSAVASQEAANSAALASTSQNIYTPAQKQTAQMQVQGQHDQAVQKLDTEHQANLTNLQTNYNQQVKDVNAQIQANQTADQNAKDQAVATQQAKLDAQIKNANTTVNDLNDAISHDQSAVKTAQANLDQANQAVQDTQNKLNKAKAAGSQASNQQSLPKTWVNVYNPAKGFFRVDFDNWKDTDLADQRQAQFDANGQLTGKDAIEINIFIASVLNEIRQQIGTPLLHINQTSVDTARANALEYAQNNKGEYAHKDTILDNMQKRANASSRGECSYEGGIDSQSTYESNLANIKEQVYQELIDFIDDDYRDGNNGGHRRILLGIDAPFLNYIGFNANKYYTRYLLLKLDNPVGNDYPLIGQTVSTPAPDLTGLTNALVAAQTKQKSAKDALDSANGKLSHDQDLLTKAQTKLTNLKNQKSNQTTDSSTTDSPAVKALKNKLTSLKTKYDQAVKAENDRYNAKKKALDDQLAKQIADIKAHPENVDQLKAENAKKLDALKQAHEDKLADIKSDVAKQLDAYKQELANGHAKDNQAITDKIAKLQAELDKSENTETGSKGVDNVVAGNSDHYTTSDGTEVKLNAGNGSTIENVAKATPISFDIKNNEENSTNALPQTGNNNSIALIALGAMASMLGLGLARKREY